MPRIFLTAPLSYAAVGLHHAQGEKLLCYGKLAISSYLIKGQIELTVGEEIRRIQAGDFVTIPQGSVHAMQRIGASEALFLDIAAPPDVGDVIWHE